MKTSNLILTIFVASFFFVSAVGFTLGKFYPPEEHTTNFDVEGEKLESFSVIVSQGVRFNISLADSNYFEYNKPILSNNDIDLSILPSIEVRNDTCFVSLTGPGNPAYIRLYAKSLKAVNLGKDASMFANRVNFDSLSVRSLGGEINFDNNVTIDYLNFETEGKGTANLGNVRHLYISGDGTNIHASGANLVEGNLKNGAQLHLIKSNPKLDFHMDDTSKIYIQ
ncbi:MAG TPA: hypothetical protein VK921_19185 [Anditalea sp.]|nr:hypothetical protein [Anditalea sp.]